MFKRRRSVAASGASGLPFCAMCGQAIRVDASSGRCALGHRVAISPVAAVAAAPAVADVSPLVAAAASSDYGLATESYVDRYADTIAWEPAAPLGHSEPASDVDALDEFIAWEQPGGGTFSALDVDTAELPLSEQSTVAAAPADDRHDLGSSLLDELDDAAHARRQAVGTIGATIAFSGMVFVAVAALPF